MSPKQAFFQGSTLANTQLFVEQGDQMVFHVKHFGRRRPVRLQPPAASTDEPLTPGQARAPKWLAAERLRVLGRARDQLFHVKHLD